MNTFFEDQEVTLAYIYSDYIIAVNESGDLDFVLISNMAPIITSSAPKTAKVDLEYIYQATAVDPDNDLLKWSLSGAPAGMKLGSEDGLISWIPTEAKSVGPITLTVTDGRTGQDHETFKIEVSNDEPSSAESATKSSSGGGGGCFIESLRF